ncbi:MAG: multidrug transporter AcrB [Phycisphaerae bacterium]
MPEGTAGSQGATVEPGAGAPGEPRHGFTNAVVRVFLRSNLSIILILLAVVLGAAALFVTPREEDPQIVVPLADVYVSFPGRSAQEVEQLVSTPLERILYQIDGVEYVYSMSREGQAIITVRFYVGEDRERSLVKLFKKLNENQDLIPPGVAGWVMKPVEIDDVPIVTLTLTSRHTDDYALRRVAEEAAQRLAGVKDVSRCFVIGGRSRVVHVYLHPDRMRAHDVSPLEIERALAGANVTRLAGDFTKNDAVFRVEAGRAFASSAELGDLVVGVSADRPAFLKDVAEVLDGPEEASCYVRHGWGPGRAALEEKEAAGSLLIQARSGRPAADDASADTGSSPAVTIAVAKKKGSNAVWVSKDVLAAAAALTPDVIPDDVDVVITRNAGLTSNEKVNELVEALAVALVFVVAVLTVGLGWRESLIVALAVPVVFGLTLAVNMMAGYTINRVTLFALILSLGLLVDDPIVDVENISRHFHLRRRATRAIVLEAVAEIRPPLITATLAVIVSFLPMLFLTGMMGPYMRPMAVNVPVTMLMSMVVAFTITPWLSYHLLKKRHGQDRPEAKSAHGDVPHGPDDVRRSPLYKLFYPLMAPLLRSRRNAGLFLAGMALLTLLATGLAATRHVPLKMLPFGNKDQFQLVLDFDEGTTLERADAAVRDMERFLRRVPEVTDFTTYVGLGSPMDFNGMVRHYYIRQGPNVADIQVNLVGKESRSQQTHGICLRLRDELTAIAAKHRARLKIVEPPPGPPVLATIVAEVYGRADHDYADLIAASRTVKARLTAEPGVVDVDDYVEADAPKLVFTADKEKAMLSGVSVADVAATIEIALAGRGVGTVAVPQERNPLMIEVRLPRPLRSSEDDLSRLYVKGAKGRLVPLAELGRWSCTLTDKTIYHKNLQPVVYVLAETAGRPPADVVVDVQADQREPGAGSTADQATDRQEGGEVAAARPRPVKGRTFFSNGSGLEWSVPPGIRVDFAGEGEWKMTLEVFRDLGIAFGVALVGIYILLVAQTGSFVIPVVVMLAIPLTILGIMPGFWLLNVISGGQVGGYADPIFFTATGMIGMIALAGIVTRDSIILVDFIHLSLARGRTLFDAIMESRVVRLRPILLTAATAMLSAIPIVSDPVFSGLAWSLIFGLLASTVFTLFVIPVTYWLLYAHKPGHGLPRDDDEMESPVPSVARPVDASLAQGTGATR